MNDLISIIIPTYNASLTINRCIESIIKQTYNNIEIIIINDGSTDNTLEIIKKYQEKDDRILIIDKINEGVSIARNTGIEKSNGKYIVFVDSDDYIHETMIEKMYNNIDKKDIVICKKYIIKQSIVYKEQNDGFTENVIDIEDDKLFQFYNTSLLNPPYCKMYKKQILINKNIYFDSSISYAEDLIFNIKYFSNIKNIRIINEHLYFYDTDYSTLTNKMYFNIMEIKEKIINELIVYYKDVENNIEFEKIKLDIMTNSNKNYLRFWLKYQIKKWKNVFKINVDLFTNIEMNLFLKIILRCRCFIIYSVIKKMEKRWKNKKKQLE